ncbi:MAG: Flp pilus assembly protein CpaB [Bdellovibrionales bacterium]
MNGNPTRTLWLSIGAAMFSIFLMYSYSQEKKKEYDDKFGAMKQVLIAKEDILEMSDIDESMVDLVERPVDFVEPGALTNPEEAIGLIAAVPLKKGEQVLDTKILRPGKRTGLSLQVAPTKRAITIPIDEVRGVARLIRPGDRIDLMASLEEGTGRARRTIVKTIMQDVSVLATGVKVTNNVPRLLEEDGESYQNLNVYSDFSSITVELDPKSAQEIIYLMATSPGSLYLSLRNPNDRTKLNLAKTTQQNILGVANLRKPQFERRPASKPQPVAPAATPKRKKKRASGAFQDIN